MLEGHCYMSVILHVEPKQPPMTREEFCATKPPFSIALDGYVSGSPWFDCKGPRLSFNHHEFVDRLATRATCGQVLMAIRQGLFSTFVPVGKLHLYVNDCDEDVCLSVFLLRHGFMAKNVANAALNKIVFVEDAMDTTAGAYVLPPDENLAWVFEPYGKFKLAGGLDRKIPEEFVGVIVEVESRISQYIAGDAGKVAIDTSYEVIEKGHGWVMAKEIGPHAKTGIFKDGYKAYITVRARPEDKRYTYTVGKVAFSPLDLNLLFEKLNLLEPLSDLINDVWGGGSTVGGSPRVNGSKLTPDQVARVVNDLLLTNTLQR